MINGKLGIGIIGAGGISNAHADGYLKLPNEVQIVAVADVIYQKAQDAAKRWNVRYAFEDYHKLLEIEEIDAISVCTYNAAHCQPTVEALKANKHVIVEKPMAANGQEALTMVKAAKNSKKILMVGMKWRFMPEVLAARKAVEDGLLGRIYYAEAFGWQKRGIPGGTFIKKETAVGGALMDNGVYNLDAVLYIMGHPKPISVSGSTAAIFGNRPNSPWNHQEFSVEDFGISFVRFEGGLTLIFGHAWAVNFDDHWQVKIAGEDGGIQLAPLSHQPTSLKILSGGYDSLKDVTPKTLPEGSIEISYEVKQFVNAIGEGLPSPVPGNTFLYTNLIFDGIYESAKLRREIMIRVPKI